MEGLTALLAELIATLRGVLAVEVCPGGWPWAVSALGVVVGLLPTVGLVVVAVARRRIGSRYGLGAATLLLGTGLLTAGLLPWLAFTATGRIFTRAAADRNVAGLTTGEQRDLGRSACFDLSQSDYLGGWSVGEAFAVSTPLRLGLAAVLLVLVPLVAAVLVMVQARLALRRGPGWPALGFWVPLLALALLTTDLPAGSTGHLWLGVSGAAVLGIPVVALAGVPSREVVARSSVPPGPNDQRNGRPVDRSAAPRPLPVRSGPPGSGPAPDAHRSGYRPPAGRGPTPTLVAPTPGDERPPVTAAPPLAAAAGTAAAPRFRIVHRLGSGGFGRVWLAEDARLGHRVALKAAHAPDAETEQRIQREARALAAIRHRNCVRIHDLLPASSDPGLRELDGLVIVMEYVDGHSLGQLVRSRGVLDDVTAARVWAGVGGALDAAHRLGVLHRDVKPGNIVVDRSGLAHLIDFGIARRTGDATMTMAGFVLGTPDFLAPEVARGDRATPASDSWQLAATLSFALTGHPPRGGHPDAMSGLRAAATGAALSHLPPQSAHTALLRASLDNDPAKRPSLAVAQRALEDWLVRIGARPEGPVPAASRGER